MKTLSRSDIPWDFVYYRTGSKVFYDYYAHYSQKMTEKIWVWYEFFKAGKIYWEFYSVIFEKLDIEPTRAFLGKFGIRHGVVFWCPRRILEKPKWWIRLPAFMTRRLLHSSHSAFSILDRSDYWNKWSPNARAHRRKIHEFIDSGKLDIIETKDGTLFLDIYQRTLVPDPNKIQLLEWLSHTFALGMDHLRIYIASIDWVPLAWAVFIDEGVTTEYFTSFYHHDSKAYHLGIALMDRWFHDSYELWMKYCDLDHMEDGWQSRSTRGYTKFKSSLADYDVFFHDLWIKIF